MARRIDPKTGVFQEEDSVCGFSYWSDSKNSDGNIERINTRTGVYEEQDYICNLIPVWIAKSDEPDSDSDDTDYSTSTYSSSSSTDSSSPPSTPVSSNAGFNPIYLVSLVFWLTVIFELQPKEAPENVSPVSQSEVAGKLNIVKQTSSQDAEPVKDEQVLNEAEPNMPNGEVQSNEIVHDTQFAAHSTKDEISVVPLPEPIRQLPELPQGNIGVVEHIQFPYTPSRKRLPWIEAFIRFDDGSSVLISFPYDEDLRVGDEVEVVFRNDNIRG